MSTYMTETMGTNKKPPRTCTPERLTAKPYEHFRYNGPPVKTTKRKNIVNHSVLGHCIDFAVGGRAQPDQRQQNRAAVGVAFYAAPFTAKLAL